MYFGSLAKEIQTVFIVFLSAEWVGHRREAWSADQRQERHQSWRFNRRNAPNKEHEDFRTALDDRQHIYDINGPAAASVSMRGFEDRHSLHSLPAQHMRLRDRPTVIYTRELQDLQRQADLAHRDIYVEDIEGIEYAPGGQILDNRLAGGRIPHREIRINAEEDHDTDSMRRHEVERGSDLGRGSDYRRIDANRDVDKEGREYHLLLHRGSNQRASYAHVGEGAAADPSTVAASRREQFYIRDGDAEILRLVTRGRSLDEQEFAQVGPQPQQRPMTLVPPRQHHSVRADDGKEIIMQRFMEDQRNNNSSQQAEDADDRGLLTSLHQQDALVRRLLAEEARLNNTLLLTEALVAQRQHEQFLATAGENVETQSLPGQTTMATQTDVDSSTQTEPLHLMRPPRRRARSDNDDSYTEEEEQEGEVNKKDAVKLNSSGNAIYGFWIKKHRSKRRRNLFHRGDVRVKRAGGKGGLLVSGKRHKIKTPILEETESALEAAEGQHDHIAFSSYAQNKTSMLRRRKNKAKVATTSGEIEVTVLPNQLQNELDDVEETPTDSLEEGSPSDKKNVLRGNKTDSRRRTQTPKTISTSLGDVRHVNFEDGGGTSSKMYRIEFEDGDIRGNNSDKWNISDSKRQSVPEKVRVQAPAYATSSESNGRHSEQESSAEAKDSERHSMPESTSKSDMNQLRNAKSDTGLNVLTTSGIFRRNSDPNNEKIDKKNRSSRRGSFSEPDRTDLQDLSQRQTASSRAKSVSYVNKVGKTDEDIPAPKKGSRYMEWYKTKREERERRKQEQKEEKKEKQMKKYKPNQNVMTDKKGTKNSERVKKGSLSENRSQRKIGEVDVDKELERAEEQILKVTVLDDDMDSGIAMSSMVMGGGARKKRNQQLLEKKSVFTIAYDDMQTKQIRPDSSSPTY